MQDTPSYEEYRAADHSDETAEALVGIAAICTTWAQSVESLGDEGRERLAEAYEEHGRMLDADPHVRAEREDGGRALEAMQASTAAGESPEVAQERAKKASGRSELRFDYTERADQLRREAFAAHGFVAGHVDGHSPRTARAAASGTGTVVRRAESNGAPRASSSRSRSSPSSDDDPSEPPERRCRNPRCREIFSSQDRRRRLCDECSAKAKNPAFRKWVGRAPLDGIDPGDYELRGRPLAETQALTKRADKGCKGHTPLLLDGTAHCHKCGRTNFDVRHRALARGEYEQPFDRDKLHAHTFVDAQTPASGVRKKRRRKRELVTVTKNGITETVSRAELLRRAEGVIAA